MRTTPKLHSMRALTIATVMVGLTAPTVYSADHPLSHSVVTYLPMPTGGEWDHIAISADGSRLYVGDAYERVVVIDTSDDTVAATITLPNNDYIGGIAVGPNGRVFVTTRTRLMEISPTTNTVVNNIAAPWLWEGPIVVSSVGDVAYTDNGSEFFVIDLSGGSVAFVDTVPGGDVNGLVAANAGWSLSWLAIGRLAISPNGDRLYVVGGLNDNGLYQLITIDGLSSGNYSSLTLGIAEIPNAANSSADVRLVLNSDGSLLFDCYGNVWQTSTMQVYQTVALSNWDVWASILVAQSPNGAYIYYQGWSSLFGTAVRTTWGGEELLVASGATYDLIDLDGTAGNGLTGINLPEGSGWNGTGTYNAHEMVINADGDKLYIVAGSSGALAVALSTDANSGVVVPDTGGNSGKVTVRITGSFQPGTAVALRQSGQTDIAGTSTSVLTGGTLETIFDLTGAQIGAWDLVFTPASGSPWQITQGFTVETAKEEATVDLLGDRTITATATGTAATVYVRATNTGNVDLENLVITFNLTAGTNFTVTIPPTVSGVATAAAEAHTADDTPVQVWISRLAPKRTYTVEVAVSGQSGSPATWSINMSATVGYVKGTDSLSFGGFGGKARKDEPHQGAIGELCTFGDAVIKGINRELERRGASSLDTAGEGVVRGVILQTAGEYGAAKLTGLIAKSLAQLVVTALVPQALPVFAVAFGAVSDIKSCYDFVKSLLGFNVLFPSDPNDKLCTIGVGQYITGNETLRYRIRFENVSTATAAAQTVRVTDVFDSNLDWDTLVIGDSSHPDKLAVDMNSTTRMITWTFSLLNLQPNVTPPEGEGWVEFTIKPLSTMTDGTTISNQARIYFDLNDPIDTNTIQQTVDRTVPSSAVASMSANSNTTILAVSWSGTDAGAGIEDYTVYVARDDGSYSVWHEQTTSTSATYTAEAGHTYKFYSVARDKLGNSESAPSAADATTAVSALATDGTAAPCGCAPVSAVTVGLCVLGLIRTRHKRR